MLVFISVFVQGSFFFYFCMVLRVFDCGSCREKKEEVALRQKCV